MEAAANRTALTDLASVHPLDEHNRAWVERTHPAAWDNPEPAPRYNLLVIGGGPAGLVAAAGAAGLGAKVALVEKHLLGGDCLNVGCVPSKALIRSARSIREVREASQYGVVVPDGARVDFGQVMERMRTLRARISKHDAASRFRELGIDVFLGGGRFIGPEAFEIGGKRIRFSKACIATGARAAAPPIPGLKDIDYLTNETLFSLTQLPKRLAVIGAGPIGCEMAQAFARFGSEVALIEAMHGVLPREDSAASDVVLKALKSDGVKLYCCGKDLRISAMDGKPRLSLVSHEQSYDLVVDRVLVSVGRAPNVEELGLEAAGIAIDKTGILVNEYLQTNNPRIYAAGDICSKYKFTHAADAQARIVIRNALFFGWAKASALTIPWCTYTDPEVSHVGLSVVEAKAQGVEVQSITISWDEVDRAILDGETEGFLQVLLRPGTDRILGATLVGRHAGDMISEIALAMTHGIGLGKIGSTVHPYPTKAEIVKKAGDAYNRTRLTPKVKRWLKLLLAWRR
ncbi:MAG: mercuric reductase [Planctomycetota bacterium]|nr:mercuric reductase [Planctomycetota bacterium]